MQNKQGLNKNTVLFLKAHVSIKFSRVINRLSTSGHENSTCPIALTLVNIVVGQVNIWKSVIQFYSFYHTM